MDDTRCPSKPVSYDRLPAAYTPMWQSPVRPFPDAAAGGGGQHPLLQHHLPAVQAAGAAGARLRGLQPGRRLQGGLCAHAVHCHACGMLLHRCRECGRTLCTVQADVYKARFSLRASRCPLPWSVPCCNLGGPSAALAPHSGSNRALRHAGNPSLRRCASVVVA